MRFNRLFFRTVLFVVFLFGAPLSSASAAATQQSFVDELVALYNGYSRYLDTQWDGVGWRYSVPSAQYKEVNRTSTGNLRLQATFASAYRFRQDEATKEKMRKALLDGLSAYSSSEPYIAAKDGPAISTSSFNDVIGLYLVLRLLEARPDLLSSDEQREALAAINKIYPWALMAEDTENRALLGAAYGLAILKHPLMSFSSEDKWLYHKLIRQKVAVGLKSIGKDFVYREGEKRQFSLHYHLVSASMLAYLGQEMQSKEYQTLAKNMLTYIHRRYPPGRLSWRSSGRPRGIGLQTLLLRALGEKFLGNKDWLEVWQAEKIGRLHLDKRAPGRLAWRDQVDGTLNDDYSFISMTELLFWD